MTLEVSQEQVLYILREVLQVETGFEICCIPWRNELCMKLLGNGFLKLHCLHVRKCPELSL